MVWSVRIEIAHFCSTRQLLYCNIDVCRTKICGMSLYYPQVWAIVCRQTALIQTSWWGARIPPNRTESQAMSHNSTMPALRQRDISSIQRGGKCLLDLFMCRYKNPGILQCIQLTVYSGLRNRPAGKPRCKLWLTREIAHRFDPPLVLVTALDAMSSWSQGGGVIYKRL